MAKLNMKKVRIFAPKAQQKELIKALQSLGALDFSASPETPPEGFYRESTNPELSRKLALEAENALKIINRISPPKKGILSLFSGRREVTMEEFFSAADKTDNIKSICEQTVLFERKIAENKAEIVRLNALAEQLSPWAELDIPLSFSKTEKTVSFIGSVLGNLTLEQVLTKLAELNPNLEPFVQIIGVESGQTLIFLTVPSADSIKAEESLRQMGFSRPPIGSDIPPKEKITELYSRVEALNLENEQITAKIAEFAKYRNDIELVCDWHLSAAERKEVLNKVDETSHTVCITGYIPEVDLPLLTETLNLKFTVYLESEDVIGDEVPVKIKNNAFSEPAETVTSMYALPSSVDIDPTAITSFFYYLFFGIMLSDAGYGLLMWIATWAVNKFLNPEEGMRKNMKLFMYCGISTTFWGFFFGSFFGVDIITEIFKAITGSGLPFKYPFINPLNGDALAMLILSIALGLLQIFAGLIVKFYITVKQQSFLDALLDIGLWITTLLGFTVLALGLVVAPILKTIGLWVAVVSMVLIAITGGRKKKGLMKVIGGVANLYDITGYVSDLLSFSRLMALGLTTAAMSMVFNMLGLMVSGSLIGKVLMVLILLVGHAVNFGLNALGAYVHTLRLQYVELFSKFYEGGGRPFMPFAFKGKYIRIKEEK